MTSADLSTAGFKGWRQFRRGDELSLLAALPVSPGVYCFRCTTQMFRLTKGASDIIYIGSAANVEGVRGRFRHYFHPGPTEFTNKRLLTRCGDTEGYEIGYRVSQSARHAQELESALIAEFFRQHEQFPPENRQQPQPTPSAAISLSKAQRMFDAVASAPMGRSTRAVLLNFVEKDDCQGILRYLERCVATQRDVGRSIQAAGRASFESQIPLVRAIYEEP